MRSALLIVLMLIATACQSTSETPEPRAVVNPHDPCALLSPAQVEDALGSDVRSERLGESRPGPEGVVPLCLYETGPPFSTLALHVEQPVSRSEFDREIDRDPRNTETLDGIGDAAFIHAGVSILVLQDGTVVGASLQHFEDIDETRRALVRLGHVLEDELLALGR